jgi:hypothetical protein
VAAAEADEDGISRGSAAVAYLDHEAVDLETRAEQVYRALDVLF